MNSINKSLIKGIRRFNRFYTNILGLLDQHMPNSEFSLSEARVLYEIENIDNCTSKKLIEKLSIDPGYLSRMIKRFEKYGLTYRVQSREDGRLYYLYLTEDGREALLKLNEMSDIQIYNMINELQEQDKKRLVGSMEEIENVVLEESISSEEKINIRCELKPGDIGYLIYMHGWIYAKECGYNHVFEGYVCKTFYEFFESYNSEKDRIWFAEVDGKIIGAVAIIGRTAKKAQLRWFILHPEFRGKGIGNKLLSEALNYCKEKGYQNVFLETTEDQEKAIGMYKRVGFRKVAEHENYTWGKKLI